MLRLLHGRIGGKSPQEALYAERRGSGGAAIATSTIAAKKIMEGLKQKGVFETQFARRETIPVGRGNASVADLAPERLKPGNPIYFIPPFGFSVDGFKPVIKTLSKTRRVLSIDNSSYEGDLDLTEKQQTLVAELKLPEVLVRKALGHIKVAEHKGTGASSIMGHSQGAGIAAIAALLRPDLFPNINLFSPPGLVPGDSATRLAKGFIDDFTKKKPTLDKIVVSEEQRETANAEGRFIPPYEAIPKSQAVAEDGANVLWEGLKYVFPSVTRASDEVFGMAAMQMGPILMKLREEGVNVVIMSGVDDTVFPHTNTMETLANMQGVKGPASTPEEQEKRIQEFTEKIANGVVFVRGGHGQIGENPELYATYAEHLLTNQESQRQSPQ